MWTKQGRGQGAWEWEVRGMSGRCVGAHLCDKVEAGQEVEAGSCLHERSALSVLEGTCPPGVRDNAPGRRGWESVEWWGENGGAPGVRGSIEGW